MLLYTKTTRVALREFGIQIPSAPDKTDRILAALRKHPVLGTCEDAWHLQRDDTLISREDLLRVHSPAYVERLFSDELEPALLEAFELVDAEGKYHRYTPETATRRLRELFENTMRGLAGTYQCCVEALRHGFCFYLGGGAHHAHRDFGHGFCVVNDSVVALRRLQAEGRIRTAWVIDVDAHKGDGTAALTEGDPTIRTLSAHMAEGWPLDGPARNPDGELRPAFIPSDIDVPIRSGEEPEYVARLDTALQELAAWERPDVGLVLCGADPYEEDELPSTQGLSLSLERMNERDHLVYSFLRDRGIPAAFLMAGGYGNHAWKPYVQFLTSVLRCKPGSSPSA
jgi:acetoin utilization deacetylase AcuC-like enzyme